MVYTPDTAHINWFNWLFNAWHSAAWIFCKNNGTSVEGEETARYFLVNPMEPDQKHKAIEVLKEIPYRTDGRVLLFLVVISVVMAVINLQDALVAYFKWANAEKWAKLWLMNTMMMVAGYIKIRNMTLDGKKRSVRCLSAYMVMMVFCVVFMLWGNTIPVR